LAWFPARRSRLRKESCSRGTASFYTDGVTEAQNAAGEFFGREMLRDAVSAAGTLDCAGIHDAVQQALRDLTGGAEQSDDIKLVVAEYRGAQS
jgi:serine phosphatase RsbU (regulator of sigma subunit)